MPSWMVLITGSAWDLEALEADFASGDPRVFRDGDDRFVESSDVQAVADEAGANKCARGLVAMINGAMIAEHGNEFEPVAFGGLVTFNAHGGRDYYDRATAKAKMRVRGSAGQRPSSADAWVGKRSDPSVATVLRILGRHELDWYDLYKIYETIKRDAGDAQVKRWTPRADLFRRTANNAAALGDDARHPELGWAPPPTPMEIDEARTLVQNLAADWLPTK
jgi:hypothetical protein